MKFTVYGKESFLFPKLITEKDMKKGFHLTHVKNRSMWGAVLSKILGCWPVVLLRLAFLHSCSIYINISPYINTNFDFQSGYCELEFHYSKQHCCKMFDDSAVLQQCYSDSLYLFAVMSLKIFLVDIVGLSGVVVTVLS